MLKAKRVAELLKRFIQLSRTVGASQWEQGRIIGLIYEGESWRHLVTASGGAIYTSFAQFSERALKMSRQSAMMLLDVAAQYSRTQVAEFGVSRLYYLLRFPAGQRAVMLRKVRVQGLSSRQIQALVVGLPARTLAGRPAGGRQTGRHTHRHLRFPGYMVDQVRPMSGGEGVEIVLKRIVLLA
jgi:hypothetical protein